MTVFETVSFHIVKPCNMKCKFCYATFDDFHVGAQLSKEDACIVIDKLHDAGVQKITFAGGEPLLYKHIKAVIRYAKSLGITTSIITNGSLLSYEWLIDMQSQLDWIGISIDSMDEDTNTKIGRTSKNEVDYMKLIETIKSLGYRLKINTVINRFNHHENLNRFLNWARPERWKVFQTLKVSGQNDAQFEEIKCSESEYQTFLERHRYQQSLVPESNEAMTGSYLLIDPLGRLFENSKGRHTYSESVVTNDFNTCLSQIDLDRDMFIKRGGLYKWN